MKIKHVLAAVAATVTNLGGSALIPLQAHAQVANNTTQVIPNLWDKMYMQLRINDKQSVSWQESAANITMPKDQVETKAKSVLDHTALPILELTMTDSTLQWAENPAYANLIADTYGKLVAFHNAHAANAAAYTSQLIKQGKPEAALMLSLKDDMAVAGSLGGFDQRRRNSQTVEQVHAIIDHYTNEVAFTHLAESGIDLTIANDNGLTIKFDKKQNTIKLPLTMLQRPNNSGPFPRVGPMALAVRDIAARHAALGERAKYNSYDLPFETDRYPHYSWDINIAIGTFLPDAIKRLEALPAEPAPKPAAPAKTKRVAKAPVAQR